MMGWLREVKWVSVYLEMSRSRGYRHPALGAQREDEVFLKPREWDWEGSAARDAIPKGDGGITWFLTSNKRQIT